MKILICGLGSIGQRHLRNIRKLGAHEVWAYRTGKAKLELKTPPERTFTDFDEALAQEPDGVVIANPSSMHLPLALKAAEAGVPLMIEKPLGHVLHEAREFAQVAARKKVPVLMAYNAHFHRGFERAHQLISEKRVGAIRTVQSVWGTWMPGWHPWEDYRESYAALSSQGGGVTLTLIHEPNLVMSWFGAPAEIHAMEVGGDVIGIEADEGMNLLIRHETGVTSNIHLNYFQKPAQRFFNFVGTEGSIHWDVLKGQLKLSQNENWEEIPLGLSADEMHEEQYVREIQHFFEVMGGAKPLVPLESGIRDLELVAEVMKQVAR